ncbi:polysaccharide deacetylase family protein [Acidobacteria bacterium AB60]|nr:polysaccharide deacetylase family protein [Acidobacteria bacterium AB60]
MLSESVKVALEGISALAALGLAAGGCAYAAMAPRSQIFGDTLVAPQGRGQIALTFDDGPNPAWTPQLLDLLAKHRAHATFFLVGKHAMEEPYLTRYIAEAGHVIGNHSWSHPNLALASPRKVRDELKQTKQTLEHITGAPVRFFRPPYGARRPDVLAAARDLGMIPVLWNAMTNDWAERSGEKIGHKLSERIDLLGRRGWAANVVLHDGAPERLGVDREPSIQAARILLERYIGVRRFVTVDAWV